MLVIVELAVEVCAVEIKCVDLPVIACSNGKNGADTSKVCDWGISVKVINAEPLRESTGYKACFVLLNGSIGLALDAKYLFATDDVLVCRSGNVDPSSSIF